MNINEVSELLENIPQEQRGAITALIEIKTSSSIDKVMNRLDAIEVKFDTMKWLYVTTISLCAFMVATLGVLLKFFPG